MFNMKTIKCNQYTRVTYTEDGSLSERTRRSVKTAAAAAGRAIDGHVDVASTGRSIDWCVAFA
jgi:hypothetical protein